MAYQKATRLTFGEITERLNIIRDAIIRGLSHYQIDRDIILRGLIRSLIEKDLILSGYVRTQSECGSILEGSSNTSMIEIDSIIKGLTPSERDSILAGFIHSLHEADSVLRGLSNIEKDSILRGIITYVIERGSIISGHIHSQMDRDSVLSGRNSFNRDAILNVKTPAELDFVLRGIIQNSYIRSVILRGITSTQSSRDSVLTGKDFYERSAILKPTPMQEVSFILSAYEILPPGKTKRFTLLDTLNLRTTAVYRKPRNISNLKIVYGDFSNSRIPCTPLDKDGYIYHISDRPMQTISKVYVEGEPKTSGYKSYTSYQDETGKAIACVIFDNPQYDKNVAVSGKGAIKLDTGELIENPADLIQDIFLNVQGYDISTIDMAELSRFYIDCLKEDIRVACILDSVITIKAFLDELALNIHARWMISDGKSVMRLKWL